MFFGGFLDSHVGYSMSAVDQRHSGELSNNHGLHDQSENTAMSTFSRSQSETPILEG